MAAYTVVTYGAAGGFGPSRAERIGQSLEGTTIEEATPSQQIQNSLVTTHRAYRYGGGPSPTWVEMGTNDAGSTVMVTTRNINVFDVESGINQYGPGIILTGRHNGIYPLNKELRFYLEDLTLAQQYSGQVQVLNFNLSTRNQITNLGSPGQIIYAAWCISADCEILLGMLH